jgi:hypothetical protein
MIAGPDLWFGPFFQVFRVGYRVRAWQVMSDLGLFDRLFSIWHHIYKFRP